MKTLKNGEVIDNCETVIDEMLGIIRDMQGSNSTKEQEPQFRLLENKISILVAKIELLVTDFDKTAALLQKMKEQTADQHERDDENGRYIDYLKIEVRRLAISNSRLNDRFEEF